MTRLNDFNRLQELLEKVVEEGFEGLARAISLLINEAMKIERQRFLCASPYERTERRRGYANGFKKKRVKTRIGELDLDIPQVRDVEGGEKFYASSLERGVRSERALSLCICEMYLNGVATRKVAQITEKLCGFEISSSQVSRLCAKLDEELELWRNRKLGKCEFLILGARYENVRQDGKIVPAALMTAMEGAKAREAF